MKTSAPHEGDAKRKTTESQLKPGSSCLAQNWSYQIARCLELKRRHGQISSSSSASLSFLDYIVWDSMHARIGKLGKGYFESKKIHMVVVSYLRSGDMGISKSFKE
ncbi:hypothetical protein PsorP6_006768 [Peronosclerospora sorghi]|uniref:Uncharacterized protein n=1 Tax=Peronosclerospora sorghi TaxID=230839 RepID=A0ACC0W7D4_9STRA|nr:hypothetical protein PsorP6_006768 [Peronosclerospora sorghi]